MTALAVGLDIAARSGDIDWEVGRVRRGLVGRDDPEVGDTIKGEVSSMRDSTLVSDLSGFNQINNIHTTLASMHRILIEVNRTALLPVSSTIRYSMSFARSHR